MNMKNKKEMEDNEHGMRETAGGMRERAFREEGERSRRGLVPRTPE